MYSTLLFFFKMPLRNKLNLKLFSPLIKLQSKVAAYAQVTRSKRAIRSNRLSPANQ